ncbi:hypothetical protein C8R42DRAFT_133563 [Lentinula raphanica]|nr:hypothetical protein C8R42DRAFT_133563 [Lentinula raphanica]
MAKIKEDFIIDYLFDFGMYYLVIIASIHLLFSILDPWITLLCTASSTISISVPSVRVLWIIVQLSPGQKRERGSQSHDPSHYSVA